MGIFFVKYENQFFLYLGVPHGRDLFYQFGVPLVGHKLYTYTEKDKEASRHLMKLIGRFVRYG